MSRNLPLPILVAALSLLVGVSTPKASQVYVTQWPAGSPTRVATDYSDNVFVADFAHDRIMKFTSEGTLLTQWGTRGTGNGEFNGPHGLAVDAAGSVFVADTFNHRVQKFTNDGVYLTQWGDFGIALGQFHHPRGLAIDVAGNVYVAEQTNHRIQKFTNDGTYLTTWGSYGTGDGQFHYPYDVAIDASYNVYVLEYLSPRIQVFTDTGQYLSQWTADLNSPIGLAFDVAGHVYIADTNNNRVAKFTNTGLYLDQWGAPGSANGQFNLTSDVTLDSKGYIYVADTFNYRIQKFIPSLPTDAISSRPLTALAPNWPNPFNPYTALTYTLAAATPVTLTIYTVGGERVRTLVSAPQLAGRYSATWDGRDDQHHSLPSGTYFYELHTAAGRESRKCQLLK